MDSVDLRDEIKKSLLRLYKKIEKVDSIDQYQVTILLIISKIFYNLNDSKLFVIDLAEKVLKELELKDFDKIVIDFYKRAIKEMKESFSIKKDPIIFTQLKEEIYNFNKFGTKRVSVHATRNKYKFIELALLSEKLLFFLKKYWLKYDWEISAYGYTLAGYRTLVYYLIDYDIYYKNYIYKFDNSKKNKLIEILNYFSNYYFEKNIDYLINL